MDKNDGADFGGRSVASLAIKDVLDEMSRIVSEHPVAMEYEADARYTWPARWGALLGYLKAKHDIVNSVIGSTPAKTSSRKDNEK
jgi:hypothetical protein